MSTSERTYPVWTIKIDLPRDKIIEYKYLIIKGVKKIGHHHSKPIYEWENLPEGINRLIDTHGKKEITIFESMDELESAEEFVEVHPDKKRFMSTSDFGASEVSQFPHT